MGTLTRPDQIAAYRILTLRSALSLEVRGMKMSRGKSAYSVVKSEFGFKGNKQKVLNQLNVYIDQNIRTEK